MSIERDIDTNKESIILCADGTGNSGGFGRDSNVWRIYDSVDVLQKNQLSFYDDGVGTNKNFIFKLFGLAFGWGLSRNIRQLYKELVMHYDYQPPGPNGENNSSPLYLFGFSRGAHTIRLLAEMICTFGVLNRKAFDNEKQLNKAIKMLQKKFKAAIRWAWIFKLFGISSVATQKNMRINTKNRIKNKVATFNQKLGRQLDQQQTQLSKMNRDLGVFEGVQIKFMGVWDTVSAVGVPIDEMRDNYFFANHAFVDNKLNRQVKRACHALAIDEKRHTFKPELWDQSSEYDKTRIKQVWFAGVHANVGGGYPKDQLALVSLNWMIKEAETAGLRFSPNKVEEFINQASHLGKLYDSRSGLAATYRYKPRNLIELISKAYGYDNAVLNIHESAYTRIVDSPAEYAPLNLPDLPDFDQVKDEVFSIEIKQSDQSLDFKNTKAENNPWNVVWLQRALHTGFMVFLACFFYIGITLTNQNSTITLTSEQPTLNWLGSLLISLNEANPFYITNKLLPGFANNPDILVIFILIFLALMTLRGTFKKHLNNIANTHWNRHPYNKNKINSARLKTNIFHLMFLHIAELFRSRKFLNRRMIPFIYSKAIPIVMTIVIFTLAIIIVKEIIQIIVHLAKLYGLI